MIKSIVCCIVIVLPALCWSKETIDPVIIPGFYSPTSSIAIRYDVTGTPLANLTEAFAWVWIPGKNIDSKYNINPASADVTKTNNVKFVKSIDSGKTIFTLTVAISSLFDTDITSETQFGILLKGNDWINGQTTDHIATFWNGEFELKLKAPGHQPFFGEQGDDLLIAAETPVVADYRLYSDGDLIDSQSGITQYNFTYVLSASSNYATLLLEANAGADHAEHSFQVVFPSASPEAAKPSGILPGINYDPNDDTKVALSLWAPLKNSVYVVGEFTDWKILPEFHMKKDGEYFWLEVLGLTTGQEYAFQYLVDEALYVADPYADKILDPDDQHIPAEAYPGLKPFPQAALKDQWYFNRLSILQTGQLPYDWQVQDFEKPEKTHLVIYELLIRDFFGPDSRNYQNLIDTLSYLKRLGINAIELMPITEFNGNESWGYNPAFMFAPDKYYGTKNKLKEFIDRCHSEGIAVILDVVMNQQDLPNPYVLMYYDFDTGKPTAESPWFNEEATHPFNVFFDLNHESTYVQQYLDTVNYYWVHEYKFDGYRFDLSKGYTQKNAGGSVSLWGQYDASRIAILKRMADKIWDHSPDAYVILEHFADDTEEKELAEYRLEEGKGMMVWGNYNGAYSQNTTGSGGADFSTINYSDRGWSVAHIIGYMESHDEDRLMYRNLQTGRMVGSYNIKNLNTALERMKAANVMFLTIPGPKMIWQFGELGYDQSINRCEDGSFNEGCRVSPKPVHWEYRDDDQRYDLYSHIAELLQLRNTYDVFTDGTATVQSGTSFVRQIGIRNSPYTPSPADASEMNVQIVVNFDAIAHTIPLEFPHDGAWFEYYTGHPIAVSGSLVNATLKPGEFRLYTDIALKGPVTSVEEELFDKFTVYPNPVTDELYIEYKDPISFTLYTIDGRPVKIQNRSHNSWSLDGLPKGMYVLQVQDGEGVKQVKIIKR